MQINELFMNTLSIIKPDPEQALFSIEIKIDKEPKLRFRNRQSIHLSKHATLDQSQICALFQNAAMPNQTKLIAFHSQDEMYQITTTILITPIQ